MLRKLLALSLCAALSLCFAADAKAVFITTNGDIQLTDPLPPPAKGPPLVDITSLGYGEGRIFTNQVDGAPFSVGSTIRTVGVVPLTDATNGTNTPALLPDGSTAVGIFAIEGMIISSNPMTGVVTARFTIGRAFFVSDSTGNPAGPFNIDDPTSWNFGNQFAEFALAGQQAVLDGNTLGISDAAAITRAPSQTNVSGANLAAGVNAQGTFLFLEDSTAAQNAGAGFVNPGLGAFTGDNWIRNLEVAAGFPLLDEGLVALTDQELQSTPVVIDAADLAVLNSIGSAAGFTGPFATGLGGPAQSDFTPVGAGQPGQTGDFTAVLSLETPIAYQAVPEPNSLVLLGLGAGSLAVYGRLRRRRVTARN